MEEGFESLNRGIFVVPFDAARTAGPSRPTRPLKRVYDAAYDLHLEAHEDYEKSRTEEQLDHISDWLDQCATSPVLKRSFPVHRLPIAVIQNILESLPPLLSTLTAHVHTLQARDATDLTSALRGVASGFIDDGYVLTARSGRSRMDEVEMWSEKQADRYPLLLHIQHAQLIPRTVLSELIYIFTLHPKLPLRVLLSVSSISTFLSSWTHIEPSSINLTILGTGKGLKREGAVDAILKASHPSNAGLALGDELRETLMVMDDMTGGGPAAVLKALKWTMLHHSINSPLAQLHTPEQLLNIQRLIYILQSGDAPDDLPGRGLFELEVHPNLTSTHDPAPRLSFLHALADPASFSPSSESTALATTPSEHGKGQMASSTFRRSRRRAASDSNRVLEESNVNEDANEGFDKSEGGDLKELETLHNLWKSAGRCINLWDWLQGFRDNMTEERASVIQLGENGDTSNDDERTQTRRRSGDNEDNLGYETHSDHKELDEALQDRLHASFIRFCEEARMMGMVRARGKGVGKRADEVLKGINLV